MRARWGKFIHDAASAEQAVADGFDYVAVAIEYVMQGDDDCFLRRRETFKQHRLFPEVCVSALPRGVAVTEKGFNLYFWMEYLKKAAYRLSQLGCRKIIWGDGDARVLPLEGNQGEMKEQVLQFVYMLCQLCQNYQMDVLLEPLGVGRTNYLNSMQEVQEFIGIVKQDNLFAALSAHEMPALDLPLRRFADIADVVRHVWLGRPLDIGKTSSPSVLDDAHDYRPFVVCLRNVGYGGLITLADVPADIRN